MIYLLDCTLRDGAYITDGLFGADTIKGIINNLVNANIDMIETGWLCNVRGSNGTTYYDSAENIAEYLPADRKNSKFLAMFNYGKYNLEKLCEYNGKSIDAVRIVFKKENFEQAVEYSRIIKDKGYKLFMQAYNTCAYTDIELAKLAQKADDISPEAFYIVNTLGTMYPEDLGRIYGILDENLNKSIKLGFHSHNNLQLSFALSLEFIKLSANRDIIIDSSICGMGRGAGNTCTELIAHYLNRYGSNYDTDLLLETVDNYMKSFLEKYRWGYSIANCIAGQQGIHSDNMEYLIKNCNPDYRDLRKFFSEIKNPDKSAPESIRELWELKSGS